MSPLSIDALSPNVSLGGVTPSATHPVSSKDLRHAAGEFESILLGQWLQGAEDSFASVPGSDEDQDAADEQMKGFAVQALAKAFTKAGGIGISNMVSKALEHKQEASVAATDGEVTGQTR